MEWTLGSDVPSKERDRALRDVGGRVLEIGFGTGLNLPHYPRTVTHLTIIDDADILRDRVEARIAAAPFPVERAQLSAERLPFDDATFDRVVSTWTLCTIPDVDAALREVRRVLRPDGRLVFLEHGRSDDDRTARWQDFLNPVQQVIACGCNLNRPIDALVRGAGLDVTTLERYLLAGVPRVLGEMYFGTARPAAA